jgi:RNA polymerase sigma factor (sigma-70 family)
MEALVQQFGRLIGSMVRRVGRQAPSHVHEDIQQRVMISLWKQLRREQTIEHPTTYIYKTAVRETMRVLRQEASRTPQQAAGPEGSAEGVASRDNPYDTLARKEKMAHIRAAIAAVAPERRLAVWAHLHGFAVAEIMKKYGWSYQKARNLIARGMADVRAILRANGLGPARPARPAEPARRLRAHCPSTEPIQRSMARARNAKRRMLKVKAGLAGSASSKAGGSPTT